MEITDEETFRKAAKAIQDEDATAANDSGRPIPPEHDVIEMTEAMYAEIFNGAQPPKDVWYVAFIRKRRSQPQFWQCQYIVNVMRLLADEYGGKVRFAYVDTVRQEKLKETFGIRTLP